MAISSRECAGAAFHAMLPLALICLNKQLDAKVKGGAGRVVIGPKQRPR
jgi:hypothetical protein